MLCQFCQIDACRLAQHSPIVSKIGAGPPCRISSFFFHKANLMLHPQIQGRNFSFSCSPLRKIDLDRRGHFHLRRCCCCPPRTRNSGIRTPLLTAALALPPSSPRTDEALSAIGLSVGEEEKKKKKKKKKKKRKVEKKWNFSQSDGHVCFRRAFRERAMKCRAATESLQSDTSVLCFSS